MRKIILVVAALVLTTLHLSLKAGSLKKVHLSTVGFDNGTDFYQATTRSSNLPS